MDALGKSIHHLSFVKFTVLCKFLLEDIICLYGCAGKIVVDRGKLRLMKLRSYLNDQWKNKEWAWAHSYGYHCRACTPVVRRENGVV